MTQDSAPFHEVILGNLLDGVVTVGRGGVIESLNPAAARMFGLTEGDAVGKGFGEVFIAVEGFDEFTDAVLEAVAGSSGATRRVIEAQIGEERRSLTVTISYLRARGTGEQRDVIAVLSDITEVRELRETELRMGKELKERHAELQKSYRQIEERNASLASMARRMQVARIVATVFVVGLFVAIGLWSWGGVDLDVQSTLSGALAAPEGENGAAVSTMELKPGKVSSKILLMGLLEPWRRVNVKSPINSTVKAIHFEYGREVAEGELLVVLDTARIEDQYRRLRKAYLSARTEYEELADWENGAEVADARRSLNRARMEMDEADEKLRRTAFMLEKGIIAAREHEEAKRQQASRQLDLEASEQALERIRAKGSAEAIREAEAELEHAENAMRAAEAKLGMDSVRAPIAGVVLASAQKDGKRLEGGQLATQGQLLVTLGDFSRLALTSYVDEVDVDRVRVGQPVRVSGDAFPGIMVKGVVTHISSQARQDGKGSIASFRVVVTLDELKASHRARLRVGMTARLRIEVYRRDDALLVPLSAIEVAEGDAWVTVIDGESGATQRRKIVTGVTTRRSVEVTDGLSAGDRIVLP